MDEINICVNMEKEYYKKKYRALKMYTSYRLGRNLTSFLYMLVFFIIGCKMISMLIGYKWDSPVAGNFFLIIIFLGIVSFGLSFFGLAGLCRVSFFKDYFMLQNSDKVSYKAVFGIDSFAIFPNGANDEPLNLDYRECCDIFNCRFGIAIFYKKPEKGKDRFKYFFPKDLFNDEEMEIIKEWQKEYLFHPRVLFERILKG